MLPSQVHENLLATIDDPDEYLTSVSGQYGTKKLFLITFGTNKRMFGPFVNVIKGSLPKFVYNFSPKSSFGEFHGSVYKSRVCSIKVYVRPLGWIAGNEAEMDDR
ncbi:hypothetical protein L2E82_06096 [Cichorium intybus]|uniref:Uncharacterized protein n=1 Tax=Cichorium intybus TaxID=13427 RepID=A0ACB9H9T9_CICIN|nr:hypothetical protein L2E82_06096 [Cichorium intybus]